VIDDGNLIKGDLLCLVKQGKYNKVPIFMGGNRNEYSAWLLWYQGPKGKWAKLWKTLPKGGNKEVSDILNEEEQKTFALTSSLASRLWQAKLVHSVARFMRQYQDNVFVYDFQWGGTKGSKVDFVLGASHANEIGYFHYGGEWDWMGRQTSITEVNKAARHALAKAMSTYQAQFAHLGTPNGEAKLPEWKAWSNEENGVKTMNLDASSEPGSAELKLFMTKREYKQEDLIREMEESNDEIVQKFTKMIAKWKLVKLECE
jgi:carboxylesterase type B